MQTHRALEVHLPRDLAALVIEVAFGQPDAHVNAAYHAGSVGWWERAMIADDPYLVMVGAGRGQHHELVMALVNSRCRSDVRDLTILRAACALGDLDMVARQLDWRDSINMRTALVTACHAGQ